MLSLESLLLALTIAPQPSPESSTAPVHTLRKVSVTATRGERDVDAVAATVTVIDEARISQEMAKDIKELVRYEPGVSAANAPTRFGIAGFSIRGVDGNRVLIRIDEVRASDAFAIGSFASARRNLIELDALKGVEIVRGPASALYGSDALGGVVSFITKDPHDYLLQRRSYVSAKSAYHSDDDSWAAGGTLALGSESLAGLLTYTHRRGAARDNEGLVRSGDRTRTAPNPQDRQSDAVLAKLAFRPQANHELLVSIEAEDAKVDTDVLSSLGVASTGGVAINTLSQRGEDRQGRERVSIGHEWLSRAAAFDSLEWRIHAQSSRVAQDTSERRYVVAAGPAAAVQRERRFEFEQTSMGAETIARKSFDVGATEHLLTYGLDAVRTRTQQLRDGVQTTLATGVRTTAILPDVFPVRDFPRSVARQVAVYAQDEIALANGAWTLTPGVRVDDHRLDPEIDAIFAADNPDVRIARIRETRASPKLGLMWTFAEDWSTYAQYAQGFRAAPYNDVNIGFTNLAAGYTAIANPGLRPETSDGYEWGLKGRFGHANLAFATFYSEYDDFIESLAFVGVANGLQIFQSRNVAKARIYGAEVRGEWAAGGPLRVRYSAAYARGDDLSAEAPLNTIDPFKAVVGLAYEPPAGRWGVEVIASAVERKRRIDERGGAQFAPPGYATIDLLAHFSVGEHVQVNLGVFNLTDKKHWEWSDVRGRPASDPAIDRYTQPGLHASASATVKF